MIQETQRDPHKTPLFAIHQELNAKMTPFAGYYMPIQYHQGIKSEHLHTRANAGLFDVSHMGQITLTGKDAASALERLVPANIIDLAVGQQRYATFTNEQGTLLDDLMVSRVEEDTLLLVVNAACKEDDLQHLQTHLANQCDIEYLDTKALLALQGPKAADVLAQLAPDAAKLVFMTGKSMDLNGIECYVTRSGYTGEDGYEISVPAADCEQLAKTLLTFAEVEMIGLGARDSLRLEAGLCLYGHDISNETTPVEASLSWSIAKCRRPGGERAGNYLGADIIAQQLENGVRRRRVGLLPQGKAPVREGAVVVDKENHQVGTVTSGSFSPTLNRPIAMGYVETELATPGTELFAKVRNKQLPVVVSTLPFVQHNYYRG